MKVHPVFHTNLLEPYHEDKIKARKPVTPPPILVDAHQEYEVEAIIDSRIHKRSLQYFVHWKGYSVMDRTWEPHANLTNCQDLLKTFHKQHPTKPSLESIRGAHAREGGTVMN
ncbi:hypothetical protein [Parasitella parasitica]|uniref:Chromo domain-containing protein n=1 Tax=Parasitella parasitica TaxID=35722 RepID=A0A0B7N275_9FUNG|nr:hypothetical protein [Parasitella parasitica]